MSDQETRGDGGDDCRWRKGDDEDRSREGKRWWLRFKGKETGEEENGGGGSRRRRKREAGQKYLGKQKKIHAEEGVFLLPEAFVPFLYSHTNPLLT